MACSVTCHMSESFGNKTQALRLLHHWVTHGCVQDAHFQCEFKAMCHVGAPCLDICTCCLFRCIHTMHQLSRGLGSAVHSHETSAVLHSHVGHSSQTVPRRSRCQVTWGGCTDDSDMTSDPGGRRKVKVCCVVKHTVCAPAGQAANGAYSLYF